MTKVIIYDNLFIKASAIGASYQKNAALAAELRKSMNQDSNRTAPRREVAEQFMVIAIGQGGQEEVAEQFKKARKAQNVTQEVLAERVGTKKSNISRLESGRYNPSLDFLTRVAEGLGKQVSVKIH